MTMLQHNIFRSRIAIVSEHSTMANILREQSLLYGFGNTVVFPDWEALLSTFSDMIPDLIVTDQLPDGSLNLAHPLFPDYTVDDMIPVILYTHADDSTASQLTRGPFNLVASLHGREEHQRLLEVIHEELDKRVFDVGEFVINPPLSHLNIVVAADDDDTYACMRNFFERQGYYSRLVANSADIVHVIQGVYPHVVFLDDDLAELDGMAMLQTIKATLPDTIVILMGTNDSPELVAECANAGFRRYLKKPVNIDDLSGICQDMSAAIAAGQEHEFPFLDREQHQELYHEFLTLKKSEENLRTLINTSGDIIFQITPQGFLNFATPAVQDQLGYSEHDLEEERINIAKFVHPADFIRVMVGIRQVIRGGSVKGLECRLMHQDRVNFRWYSINCYPMYTGEGQFVGVGGIARDISSIKGFEREIRTQNERLATLNEIARTVNQSLHLDTILQNVVDKVLQILVVQAGVIFLVDQATSTFVQRICRIHSQAIPEDKQQLLHSCALHDMLPVGAFDPHGPAVIDDFATHPLLSRTVLAEVGFHTAISIPLTSKDTLLGIMLLMAHEQRAIPDDDLQMLVSIGNQIGMAIDNIALYQHEMQAKTRLEELNKLKDDFVAIVSHDLRSPLTAILSASEVLLNDEFMDRPLTAEQKELMNNIQFMGHQQLDLVNDLLDLAKIESGHLEITPALVDMCKVAQDCYTPLGALADTKNITLNFITAPNLPKVNIDEPKIRQVINNLMSNAIKFTEPGGMVALRIDVNDEACIRISVSDTGKGIEPGDLRLLFNKFQQIHERGTQGEKGTGLGLAICKNLVELHQGEIWVESRIGVGSSFIFTLPIPERIVLIIDDSLTVIKAIKDMIANNMPGVSVKYALSGPDGLLLIEKTLPAVIILDYVMPDMDGLATFRALKHRYGSRIPPTIFLTGSQDLDIKRQIFELGADDYLQKPIDVGDLLPRLSRFL